MKKSNSLHLLFLLAITSIFFLYQGCKSEKDEIKRALLEQNWDRVNMLCAANNALNDSIILRAIKGHACLALNLNNESLELFISIQQKNNKEVWLQWAQIFQQENKKNPVANYLYGDALARLGRWKEAINSYTQALYHQKDFALALNARGVAYVYCKDYNNALEDFEAALNSAPDFADAHASLGTLKLLRNTPDMALESFSSAIEKSVDTFALALNGRGCARINNIDDPENSKQAGSDFMQAARYDFIRQLVMDNLNVIVSFVSDSLAKSSLTSIQGTTINTRSLLHEPTEIINDHLSNMTPNDRIETYSSARWNALYCEGVAGVLGYVNMATSPFGVDMGEWISNTRQDAADWRKIEQQSYSSLQNIGYGFDPGGAEFKGIGKGLNKDQTSFSFTYWFGLYQDSKLSI
jgi:tetratricopeptide (TPR) repeat protein